MVLCDFFWGDRNKCLFHQIQYQWQTKKTIQAWCGEPIRWCGVGVAYRNMGKLLPQLEDSSTESLLFPLI